MTHGSVMVEPIKMTHGSRNGRANGLVERVTFVVLLQTPEKPFMINIFFLFSRVRTGGMVTQKRADTRPHGDKVYLRIV